SRGSSPTTSPAAAATRPSRLRRPTAPARRTLDPRSARSSCLIRSRRRLRYRVFHGSDPFGERRLLLTVHETEIPDVVSSRLPLGAPEPIEPDRLLHRSPHEHGERWGLREVERGLPGARRGGPLHHQDRCAAEGTDLRDVLQREPPRRPRLP